MGRDRKFDEAIINKWIETNEVQQVKHKPVHTKQSHRKYLQSAQWKTRSKTIREQVGNVCEICNSSDNINVHHNSYRSCNHGLSEKDEDLMVLCRECHDSFHKQRRISARPHFGRGPNSKNRRCNLCAYRAQYVLEQNIRRDICLCIHCIGLFRDKLNERQGRDLRTGRPIQIDPEETLPKPVTVIKTQIKFPRG